MPTVPEVRVRDPLSDVTRRERRTLLAASALGLVIVKTGLLPTKVGALGIEFSNADQSALLFSLGAMILYFTVAFLVYAVSDFLAWRVALYDIVREKRREFFGRQAANIETGEDKTRYDPRERRWAVMARPISVVRAILEFIFPVVLGAYSVFLLLTTSPASVAGG